MRLADIYLSFCILLTRYLRIWVKYSRQVVPAMPRLLRQQSCGCFFCSLKNPFPLSSFFPSHTCKDLLFLLKDLLPQLILCFFLLYRLADLKDFKKVNEIYAKCEFFNEVEFIFVYLVACGIQSLISHTLQSLYIVLLLENFHPLSLVLNHLIL